MNRTDRLLAIVLELQGRGWRRAEDLAETFETSKRTIYRDVLALGESGVPIVSTPGRGYSLVEGYFLPPVSLGVDEATMLLLGADVVAQAFDAQYRAAAESAARKIAGVLPAGRRDEVAALQASIRFVGEDRGATPARAALLRELRGAIVGRRSVRFRYVARRPSADAPDIREADPYGLVHVSGAWYVTGFDHARRDVRTFRLDRIEDFAVLDRAFERPAAYRVLDRTRTDPGEVLARIRFDAEVARWVRESPSYFTIATEDEPDGALLVTLRLRAEDEALQWLLGWGRHAHVLEPPSLRARVREEAEAMLRDAD